MLPAAPDVLEESHLQRSEKMLRLGVGLRRKDVHADHGVGFRQRLRGPERVAINLERLEQGVGREVPREGEGQAELRGELRAEGA